MRMLFVLSAATTLIVAEAQAGDVAAGAKRYAQTCVNCHGPKGKGLASFPALAGRDAEYIADRLQRYRAKEKIGPNSGLMIPNAVGLSDDEIANLAAFVSTEFE